MSWLADLFGLGRRDVPEMPRFELDAAPSEMTVVEQPKRRWDTAANPLSNLGNQTNDKGQVARPVERVNLDATELTWAYRYIGVVRRGVNLKADDACRRGWRVRVKDEADDPLADEWRDLQVRTKVRDALRWARLYGGAIIVMITDDVPELQDLATPLEDGATILNLIVLDWWEATGSEWDRDPVSRNFGKPEFWSISPTGSNLAGSMVHHSRVLYVPGNAMPPHLREARGGYDESVIEAGWSEVRDYEQVRAGGAVIVQEMKQAVLRVHGLAEAMLADEGPAMIKAKMRAFDVSRGLLGTAVIDVRDEFSHHDQSVTGYAELHSAARVSLAAAWGYPQALLFGDAPSGLNTDGESGRSNYRDDVAGIQEDVLLPVLERLAEVCFASKGETMDERSIEFHPLTEPTDKEQAEVELLHAQADALRVNSQVLPPEHIARSRHKPTGYQSTLDPVDETDLMNFEEAAALQVMEGGGGSEPA